MINTLSYGLIAVFSVYLLFNLIKDKVKFDMNLLKGVSSFVLLGAILRVLVDKGVIPYSVFTVSPGIYITIATYFISSIFVSKFIKKEKLLIFFGLIPSLFLIPFIHISNLEGVLMVVCLTLITTTPFYLFKDKIRFDKLSFFALGAHLFDACSTWIAIDNFGYIEKHVIPTLLINASGTAFVMIGLKLVVILPVIYIIDKYAEDKRMGNLFKIVIFVMGLAPGLRNTIRLGMLV